MDTKKIPIGMTPEALEIFSKKLSLILEKRDTSLAFLCYNVGVPTSTLHDLIRIGTGVGKKSIHYLEAVCEYLGTDLESMIKTSPTNEKAQIIYSSLGEIKGRSIKKIPENIEGLKRQCREMSSERLKVHLNNSNIKEKGVLFKDIESDKGKSQDEFFSFISGDLDYARCSLKTFFDREEVSPLVEKKKLLSGGEYLSSEDIDDFMKEVTNVCMGGIKKMFENEALFVSTSLPLVMRKKDSIFIDCDESLDEVRVVHDIWNVTVNGVKITCELFFEVYNPQRFYSAISRKKIKDDSLKDEVIMFI